MATAVIAGATGQVGGHVLLSALEMPQYGRIVEFGRRAATIPPDEPGQVSKRSAVTVDFDNLDAKPIAAAQADVVLIALGTTKKNAGSIEAFRRIDQEHVVSFATAARVEGRTQRVVYCSAIASSPSSPLPYSKSKGQTEQRLAGLGFAEVIVFRPNFLAGTKRPEFRLAEKFYGVLMGGLAAFSNSMQIDVTVLGLAMAKAGVLGVDGLKRLHIGSEHATGPGDSPKAYYVSNAEAIKLATLPVA